VTSKEYLDQARFLDMRINAKLAQLESLKNLRLRAESADGTVMKIAAMQKEINRDIDSLVDLKTEITRRIRQLSKPEYQTLLELRYLCFLTWDEIFLQMRYARRHFFRLHKQALEELDRLRSRPP